MINLLKKTKKIIINSDIDGILSGIILQHFLDCEVVGFSNSDDKIWLNPTQIQYQKDFVFIDMFVTSPNVSCIDQHIVAVDKQHSDILKQSPNKINPNTIRGRFFYPKTSYYQKYPFGTVHFIIAFLEKEGYDLKEIKLFSKAELQPIDFILRADDAFYTTKEKYTENANDWWEWMLKFAEQGKLTTTFKKYISDFKGNSKELKSKVETILKSPPYNCSKLDGGFSDILTDKNKLKNNFRLYANFLAKTIELPYLKIEDNWEIYTGKPQRVNVNKDDFKDLRNGKIRGNDIFSYAFVRSFGQENSLSYTTTINKITNETKNI